MSHEFESGMFYREAAWHKLGVVVEEWPGSWAEARKVAGLEWDVEAAPLQTTVYSGDRGNYTVGHVGGWNAIVRNDKKLIVPSNVGGWETNPEALLSIQPSTYKIITNAAFGELIEHIVGTVGDNWQYETLISLAGGRQVVALLRSRTPLNISGDPSDNHTYLCMTSRHDGQGGLRCIPTNVRVVCRNTHHFAESIAKAKGVGFTVRHTSNWTERTAAVADAIQGALREGEAWEKLANELVGIKLEPWMLDKSLERLFVESSDMSDRQMDAVERRRGQVREILKSPTCEGVENTAYGFVQAVDEWCDHVRPAHSNETRASRALMTAQPLKSKAVALARALG